MARKFSLADYVQPANVSNLDIPTVRMIPWEDIRSNQANFYAVDDVEELAQSILLQGLLDPVVVTADPEVPDRWVLISGHRRHKAWGLLREQDGDKYAAIPAIVRNFSSPEMAELALIMANSSARVLTGSELDRQAMRVQELFYALQQAGYSFPGRMRDRVAEACNVSASKLARLKVIREGLETSWQSSWEAGTLPESTAYALAQLPTGLQSRIGAIDQYVPARTLDLIREAAANGTDWTCKDLHCPDGKACTHAQGALRHDLEDPWDMCKGQTCCLDCDKAKRDWSPCSRMCAKAQAVRKAKRDAARTSDAERVQVVRHNIELANREHIARYVRAADAAGIGDDVKVHPDDYRSFALGVLRQILSGDCDPPASMTLCFMSAKAADVAKDAEALHCSADYLVGLTEDLTPPSPPVPAAPAEDAPRWQSFGQALPREGEVVGVLDPKCQEWLDVYVYRAGRLVFLTDGTPSLEPWPNRYWIPLPPDIPGLGGDKDGQ